MSRNWYPIPMSHLTKMEMQEQGAKNSIMYDEVHEVEDANE